MTVTELAERQLTAYNANDLDAFCACYDQFVKVLDADGAVVVFGAEQFRERYQSLFSQFTGVGAAVDQRLSVGAHCVDLERWWRTNAEGETLRGAVLVRYTQVGDRIATVQFFTP
jgi:hypothetical protein